MTVTPPLLAIHAVGKHFGSVCALEDASLTVHAGQVTCLLGDNGAGKSTVVGLLSGVHRPSTGEVWLEGRPIDLESPRHAISLGIATVHQDLALVPLMSVWRNFFLGAEPTRGKGLFRRIDQAEACRVAVDELARFGITVRDPAQTVATLSGGERQSLAIARAIHLGARVLILDEPTAALGVKQTGLVLDSVAEATRRGVGVVLVTHNPVHALATGDHFVVLRRGSVSGSFARGDVDEQRLRDLMAGAS